MFYVELTAAVFGLVCVWLTIRQNIFCWPAGLVQVLLYSYIFYRVQLYSDLILHLVYVVLQLYGWYHWLYGGNKRDELPVTALPGAYLAAWAVLGVAGTLAWGYLMARFTDAAVPYADAFTTVMSLIAQWFMARKRLDSWHFWIAVDVVAIGVYLYKGLYPTTGLYAVFLVLATMGFFAWRRSMRPAPVAQTVGEAPLSS